MRLSLRFFPGKSIQPECRDPDILDLTITGIDVSESAQTDFLPDPQLTDYLCSSIVGSIQRREILDINDQQVDFMFAGLIALDVFCR